VGVTALVFLAAFGVYLSQCYPWLAPRDAGDLALAASTLGVSHAPGYPLHALLGRGMEALIPFGHPAWRLSLLSAVAAAAAAATLFAWARRRAGVWAGLGAAVILAASAPVWKFALLQEKYALHALFCVLTLALAEGESSSYYGRARLSGLLAGLALVNHQSFLFWLPLPFLLWFSESLRHRIPFASFLKAAVPWSVAGLSLTLYTAIRCEPGAFWETVLRKRYGTASLFAGYQRPFADALPGLLGHFAKELAAPSLVLAAAGAWLYAKQGKLLPWLAGLGGGLAFLLLTRFDVTSWAARSALEPAFLGPAVITAALAGASFAFFPPRAHPILLVPLLIVAVLPFQPGHRADFLAYDYARDLRRAVAPGGALLASGDTASFALAYDALREPLGFELGHARLVDGPAWLAARRAKPLHATGMGLDDLAGLGFDAKSLHANGLVQSQTPAPALLALRRSAAWEDADSYSKDVLLSYAFASYISARLSEARGQPDPGADLLAVLLDPEDYRWE
jgi:hypothetical protein